MNIKSAGRPGLLKDSIYQQLLDMISSGILRPDIIFTESQLIQQFGVSKSPIREALIQLCHEEVLQSLPRCGYHVIQVSAKNIHDITELRLFLELNSIPHILENLDGQKLKDLWNMARRQCPEENAWEKWNRTLQFHLRLTACTENMQVVRELERALSVLTRAYVQIYASGNLAVAADIDSQHEKILQALENHDSHGAYTHLKNDILNTERILLSDDSR